MCFIGGVDSSVVALLIHKAIKSQLKCIMVDTGLLRKMNLKNLILFLNKYKLNIKLIKAQNFLQKIKNVIDQKKKKNYWKFIYKIFERSKKIKNKISCSEHFIRI